MSINANNIISPNSRVDIVNTNIIQKNTINQINNNKKKYNIKNKNSENGTTSKRGEMKQKIIIIM